MREQRPPIIIYTDAMFRPGTPPRVAHVGGMEIHYAGSPPYSRAAFVVWDPLLQIFMHSDRVLPPAFYESLTGDDNTYILQAELIAGIAAYSSLPHIVRGRPVVHFIDNTGALSLLVQGPCGLMKRYTPVPLILLGFAGASVSVVSLTASPTLQIFGIFVS